MIKTYPRSINNITYYPNDWQLNKLSLFCHIIINMTWKKKNDNDFLCTYRNCFPMNVTNFSICHDFALSGSWKYLKSP